MKKRHNHFCPECNEYQPCEMDCDPVDWYTDSGSWWVSEKEIPKPTYQPCTCDDCQVVIDERLSKRYEKGAGI